ncbi:hypothetical protein H0H81_005912 [Sphagnurus paluster]|uniref:Uncharacterized protein n=1 Tax=Sphagnurus paluster TaxID=117069 RepID=A0A9P7KMW8_9AGAR|nr:hypothetical protein H0H81_005912 [Sphagnurus paluster]
MGESLQQIRDSIQDALDDLSSTRSSSDTKSLALHRLEQHLAEACVPKDPSGALHNFNALQYTFECNVPSRLLAWISVSTVALESITNKGSMDKERESQAANLAAQLSLSLSLIQGVTLNHSASKIYLGRKPATGVSSFVSAFRDYTDVELIAVSDFGTSTTFVVESNGVQAVVKILKRAGTPREVRMKCLEFLYFYLLDETPGSQEATPVQVSPPTVPTSPVKPSKPYLSSGRPLRPSSRFGSGSSEFSFPSIAPSSSIPSLASSLAGRSTSGSSTQSFTSASSIASGSTAPTSVSSSPPKASSSMLPPQTPPSSPPLSSRVTVPPPLQARSLMMLRKEVDYEPQSPKKAQVSRLGVGGSSRHAPGKSISKSRLTSGSEDDCQRYSHVPITPTRRNSSQSGENDVSSQPLSQSRSRKVRTTEEKREFLGTMLGNVDALVEGVRKAGIWGLG